MDKSILAVDGKWEAPDANREYWRRRKQDGSYEYRENPPDGHTAPQQEHKPVQSQPQPVQNQSEVVAPKGSIKRVTIDAVPASFPEVPSQHRIKIEKKQLSDILTRGHFTIISAGKNPQDPKEKTMAGDDEAFHRRHELLRGDLEEQGLKYTDAIGHYSGLENSFLVFHDDTELTPKTQKALMVHYDKGTSEKNRKFLNDLGEKYNQDSVLHVGEGKNTMSFVTGLGPQKKGDECYGDGWSEAPDAEDFFTDIEMKDKSHTKFQMDLKDCAARGYFGSSRVSKMIERVARNQMGFDLGQKTRRGR